jgi:uncharacterized membrane protein
MTALATRIARPMHWRGLIADIVLTGLLLGPLAAAFLQAWSLLIPHTISDIIYSMGGFVCPQPARAVALYHNQIMAVCMRCYGTVLGLLLTRLLYAVDAGAGHGWLPYYGLRALPIFIVLIFAYAAEFAGQVAGLWGFNNLVATAAGLITGAGLGLMFHPVLQGHATTTRGHARADVRNLPR